MKCWAFADRGISIALRSGYAHTQHITFELFSGFDDWSNYLQILLQIKYLITNVTLQGN